MGQAPRQPPEPDAVTSYINKATAPYLRSPSSNPSGNFKFLFSFRQTLTCRHVFVFLYLSHCGNVMCWMIGMVSSPFGDVTTRAG